jgi:hypothetical protein
MSDAIVRIQRPRINRPVIYGGAAVLVIGTVWWTRRKRAAVTDTGATDTTSAADTTGTDTGYDTGGFSDYSPAPGYGPVGVTPGDTTQYPTPPRTNAEWTQQAEAYLLQAGFDPVSSAIALGVYLASGGLTDAQYNMVTAALAGVGDPPNKPAPPHKLPPTGQKPPTTPPPKTTGPTLKAAPHLAISSHTKTTVNLSWTRVPGATHYRVEQAHTGHVVYDIVGTHAKIVRAHKTNMAIRVIAYRYTRQYSQPSNSVTVTHR